jgi:hypothetical protein
MKRVFAVFLAAAAALIPACGGDGHGGGGSVTLFTDEFSRSTVGSDWNSTGSGTAAIDVAQGGPSPALGLAARQSNSSVTTGTTMTFSARPLTVIVDLDAVTTGAGSGGVALVNAAGATLASAELFAVVGGGMTFTIGGTSRNIALPPNASGFQRVTFNVDAQGNSTWSLGETAVMTTPGFPTGPVSLRLFTRADTLVPGGVFPVFLFDNVAVMTS